MSTPRVPFDSPAVTNQIVGNFHDQPEGLYIVRTSNLTEHPKPATDRDDIRADLVITGYVVVRQNRPVKAKRLVVELLTEVELVLPSEYRPGRSWNNHLKYRRDLQANRWKRMSFIAPSSSWSILIEQE